MSAPSLPRIHTVGDGAHSRLRGGVPAGPALGGRGPPGPSSPVRRAVHGLEGEGVRGVAGAVVPLGAGGPVGAWGLQGKHVFLIMLPVP